MSKLPQALAFFSFRIERAGGGFEEIFFDRSWRNSVPTPDHLLFTIICSFLPLAFVKSGIQIHGHGVTMVDIDRTMLKRPCVASNGAFTVRFKRPPPLCITQFPTPHSPGSMRSLHSPESPKENCFCGCLASPCRDNKYCSELCARVDTEKMLLGEPSHYRSVSQVCKGSLPLLSAPFLTFRAD